MEGNITEKNNDEKLFGANVGYKIKFNENFDNILKKDAN